MEKLFFDSWESILRTALITVMSYVLLIAMLRGFGKRTLSKMNAFDFVITIALGSTLASVMLNKDVALADGVTAFLLLLGLQFIITWISVRNNRFSHIVKSKPTLLVYRGKLLHDVMKKERVAQDEIFAIIREKGLGSLSDTDAIVLETDGSLTVISNVKTGKENSLKGVESVQSTNSANNGNEIG